MRRGKELRMIMVEFELTQGDLAKAIKRDKAYISRRINHHASWEMDDVYAICDYINSLAEKSGSIPMPYGDISKFFPPRVKAVNVGREA